jgi:hypothetical protein
MKFFFTLTFLCFFLLKAEAQADTASYSIGKWLANSELEASYVVGKIVPHNKTAFVPINSLTQGAELNWRFRSLRPKQWEQRAGFPVPGLILGFYNISEPQVYGQAFCLVPNISFRLMYGTNWRLSFRGAIGLAYLTEKFSYGENPLNLVIGSNFNASVQSSLRYEHHLTNNWYVLLGGYFSHFSNGGTQKPNLGINYSGVQVGVGLRLNKNSPFQSPASVRLKGQTPKGFHPLFQLSYGVREMATNGGPKYPIVTFASEVYRHVSPYHRTGMGLGFEYNGSVYWDYRLNNPDNNDDSDYVARSLRIMPYIAHEVLLGKVAIYANLGTYLINRDNVYGPIFTKIGLRYYPLGTTTSAVKPHVGFVLKSHIATAEYAGIVVGLMF